MPPGVAVRGTAPRGASSDGPPAPRRLEQPLPGRRRSLTSVRRRAGTASSVPSPTGSLRDVCLAARATRFTRSTETACPSPLAETTDRPSWTPSTVPRPDFGFPRSECGACSLVGDSTLHAHRVHLEAAAACVSTSCGVLLGQRPVVRPALRPARRRDARCVGPVSANSLLRTSTRASSVPCCVGALSRAAQPERSPAPRQSDSLRRATRCPDVLHRGGRCLPAVVRADRASDTPVASPGDPVTLARSRGLPRAAETAADPLA
jgi:hypothetical protein